MKLFSQDSRLGTSDQASIGTSVSTLDSNSSNTFWSERCFEVFDLHLSTKDPVENLLFCRFELQRASDNFGKNQNPISPLLLSFIAEKKEVALLTGLLGRQMRIEEELRPAFRAKEELVEELQRLREENEELEEENKVLKRSLMEIQRPRRVS